MRLQSEFEIICECGLPIFSHEPRTRCPRCGREIEVHWQQGDDTVARAAGIEVEG